ncbi:hypothetical protein DFH29DRAFT_1083810 [Suillus ampliporus]|nr:hypothetical protein DFH29DRAFT_1083810 [Suillus ampliporus]
MVIALIAPELMITWAARQFFSARATAEKFNDALGAQLAQALSGHQDISETIATFLDEFPESDGRNGPSLSAPQVASLKCRGWTVTHGFFMWMGGFMLYVDGKPRATLTPDELLKFVCGPEGSVDMPIITEAEIKDKSKGDGLSKGIAILQLVWFVIQLVARYVQNLPITLLEFDTLAVATLTCIAYGLWWEKPKDVGRPCIVHWKPSASPPNKLAYDEANISSSAGFCSQCVDYLIRPLFSLSGNSVFISPYDVDSRRVPSLGGYGEYHDAIILLLGCLSGMTRYSGVRLLLE